MPTLTVPSIPAAETAYLTDAVELGRANDWRDAVETVKTSALREATAFLSDHYVWVWGESAETPQQVVRAVAMMALALLRGHGVPSDDDRVLSETFGPVSTTYRDTDRPEVPSDVHRAIGEFGEPKGGGGRWLF